MQFAQTSKSICEQLSVICKYYGTRSDLVQAGGGNISIKDKNKLYIKSSGCMLFDVEPNKNISRVCLRAVQNYMKFSPEEVRMSESEILRQATEKGSQPSLETFFHSMTAKYTVHIHPIIVIQAIHTHKKELVEKFGDVAEFVGYYKPGLELSKKISYDKNIIFLENHGLIVHFDDLIKVYNTITAIIEYCAKLLDFDLQSFNDISKIQSDIFRKFNIIPYVIETDAKMSNVRQTPDCVIYSNGYVDDSSYEKIPSCLVYNNKRFIVGKNFVKCKQIEQVLKMYECVDTQLDDKSVNELLNWDSEKYRKNC